MKFSILITAIPERLELLNLLVSDLKKQIDTEFQVGEVTAEVLVLLDNRQRSVGSKRNDLLRMAQGEYIAYIDDDDVVEPDYVRTILRALCDNQGVDVLTFKQLTRFPPEHGFPNGKVQMCIYSIHYEYESSPEEWRGKPAHTMVWRRDLVKDIRFPEQDNQEDIAWCKLASEAATTEVQLDKVLYTYRHDPSKSYAVPETHENSRRNKFIKEWGL
jgi:glycosyltransferase involved in cell wall biosynthesis